PPSRRPGWSREGRHARVGGRGEGQAIERARRRGRAPGRAQPPDRHRSARSIPRGGGVLRPRVRRQPDRHRAWCGPRREGRRETLPRSFAPRVSARVSAGRLEVGVVLPTYRALASAENIARAAALSESLAFDSVWVTDHVVVPTASVEAFGPTFFEAMTVMSYVAGITTKVKI